jgi:hypothetical protein
VLGVGRAVEVDEIQPATEAYPIIEDALHRYSEQRRQGFDGVKARVPGTGWPQQPDYFQ